MFHPFDKSHDNVVADLTQGLSDCVLATGELVNVVVLCDSQEAVVTSQIRQQLGRRGIDRQRRPAKRHWEWVLEEVV